ncbi:hypothetical protein MPER_04966, partial [Moniliophthora perniciosa FA553]
GVFLIQVSTGHETRAFKPHTAENELGSAPFQIREWVTRIPQVVPDTLQGSQMLTCPKIFPVLSPSVISTASQERDAPHSWQLVSTYEPKPVLSTTPTLNIRLLATALWTDAKVFPHNGYPSRPITTIRWYISHKPSLPTQYGGFATYWLS